jgi:hypothetical protein
MKIHNFIVSIVLGLLFIAVFLVLAAAVSVGQTKPQGPASPMATAVIPFDFWIGGTALPAGEYGLYAVKGLNSVLLVRNTKSNAQEQAFLLPTSEPVSPGDERLIFITHKGRHYLHEVWSGDGKSVLTSELAITVDSKDVRSNVPLNVQVAENARAPAK